MSTCTASSVYKQLLASFQFKKTRNVENQHTYFVVGDLKSHSNMWGYLHDDENGEAVIKWAESDRLCLVHDPKLSPTFNSVKMATRTQP